jgi:hypothetical protein
MLQTCLLVACMCSYVSHGFVTYRFCHAWSHAGEAEEEEVQQQAAADAGSSAVYQFRPQVEVGAAYRGAAVQLHMPCAMPCIT